METEKVYSGVLLVKNETCLFRKVSGWFTLNLFWFILNVIVVLIGKTLLYLTFVIINYFK